jgi:hypothetical protein
VRIEHLDSPDPRQPKRRLQFHTQKITHLFIPCCL